MIANESTINQSSKEVDLSEYRHLLAKKKFGITEIIMNSRYKILFRKHFLHDQLCFTPSSQQYNSFLLLCKFLITCVSITHQSTLSLNPALDRCTQQSQLQS